MLDIIMCITFLPLPKTYPATRFICLRFGKKNRYVDNQKVQVADEINLISGNDWCNLTWQFLFVSHTFL